MKRAIRIIVVVLVAAVAFLLGYMVSNNNKEGLVEAEKNNSKSVNGEAYIQSASGVEAKMLNADYWTDKIVKADNWTEEDIENFNKKNPIIINTKNDKQLILKELGDTIDGNIVRKLYKTVNKYKQNENYYLNGVKIDETYFDNLMKTMGRDSIEDTVKIQYGFSMERTSCRQYPTNDKVYVDEDKYFDKIVRSDVYVYMPLAVVGESKDKQWYYCIFDGYTGWIEKQKVALCQTREEWLQWQEMDEFLVVTGADAKLAVNPYDEAISEKELIMGTRLKLANSADVDATVDGRTGYGCYTVIVPKRDDRGFVEEAIAFVPISEDVSLGYLDYSAEAVVEQAFKLVGRSYGWGGDNNSLDCSGFTRAVYSCFGFTLPRSGADQITVNGIELTDMSDMSTEKKMSVLEKMPAGTLLYFNGHIMMLLGSDNGDAYVISSVSSFSEDRENILTANVVTVNSLGRTYRANTNSWLEEITSAATFGR